MLEVTRGPSLNVALLGKHWKLAGGSILYDDRLSDVEIDVICSVYETATGELSYSDINARTNNFLQVWDHRLCTCLCGQSRTFYSSLDSGPATYEMYV